jgi:hypothetical protein
MSLQTITAPTQNNHMLTSKTTPVTWATSESDHNGFGAADDIEMRPSDLTKRHGVVLGCDFATMSLPIATEGMMPMALQKVGSVDLIANNDCSEHVPPLV